jgi:hypothetical protein
MQEEDDVNRAKEGKTKAREDSGGRVAKCENRCKEVQRKKSYGHFFMPSLLACSFSIVAQIPN